MWPFRSNTFYTRVEKTDIPMIGKVMDWQDRQRAEYEYNIMNYELNKARIAPLTGFWARNKARSILKQLQRKIKNTSDLDLYSIYDHWATSEEVLNIYKGDCEDFGVAVWSYLRHNAFPDNDIGMVYVKNHIFACWHEDGNKKDFWVLDNGFLSVPMIKASKLFPFKRGNVILEPIYGFNNRTWWTYKKEV